MKKITFFTIVLIAMSFNINAQITNNGFENWTSIGSYEDPDGWATMNPYCMGSFYSCEKSTDHYPANVGSYSLKVTNNTSLTQTTGGWGIVVANSMDYPFKPAFPVIGHPNSLNGYFKYVSLNSDSLWIKVVLFNNGAMVTSNDYYYGSTAINWTPFTIPITNYTTADSATIMLAAYAPQCPTCGPKGNSSLKVDNLSFDNLITSVSGVEATTASFNLYPNPATDVVNLTIGNTNNNQVTVTIYNVLGEFIKSELLIHNEEQLSVSDLENGMYIVEVKSNNSIEKQRLLIRH